jgi:hypothetical protein
VCGAVRSVRALVPVRVVFGWIVPNRSNMISLSDRLLVGLVPGTVSIGCVDPVLVVVLLIFVVACVDVGDVDEDGGEVGEGVGGRVVCVIELLCWLSWSSIVVGDFG